MTHRFLSKPAAAFMSISPSYYFSFFRLYGYKEVLNEKKKEEEKKKKNCWNTEAFPSLAHSNKQIAEQSSKEVDLHSAVTAENFNDRPFSARFQ